eukprot:TRINITY_DN7941_c0_g1_i1.p1 TRINITY_DN7941_c0_g1~~TRINITY_DN7941_c0_g1_i1.p1  ORF type:complete len:298 (+),score=24.98 TRINITY_DN7941_c0_g1_i1:112-1005(+)
MAASQVAAFGVLDGRWPRSTYGREMTPVVRCDVVSTELCMQGEFQPGMVPVMLPAVWPRASHEVTDEMHCLAVLICYDGLTGFLEWWRTTTVQQKMEMCQDLFQRTVDKAVAQHVVAKPADEDPQQHDELCVICQSEYQLGETVETLHACGHSFHKDCLRRWLQESSHCPLCRQHAGVTCVVKPSCLMPSAAQPPTYEASGLVTHRASLGALPSLQRAYSQGRTMSDVTPSRPEDGPEAAAEADARTCSNRLAGLQRESLGEERSQPQLVLCPRCGCAEMRACFQFCPYCGNSLTDL